MKEIKLVGNFIYKRKLYTLCIHTHASRIRANLSEYITELEKYLHA